MITAHADALQRLSGEHMEMQMNAIPNTEAFREARLSGFVTSSRLAVDRARAVLAAARGDTKAVARRELKRAQTLLSRAEGALKAEQQGEAIGPAVQRQTIVDRDVVLREPRIVNHGKSVTLVTALDHLRNRSSITDEQHAAGKRYRAAWELAGMDMYPIGLGEGIGGTPCSGNRRIEEAVGSSRELSRMRAVLVNSYCIALAEHVAIYDLNVSAWGEMHGINPQYAMGQLQIVLGLLV